MYQLQVFGILIKPSLFSFTASTLVAAVLLFIANAPYILGSELLSSWLGTTPDQIAILFRQLNTDFQASRPTLDFSFLDLPIVYNIVVLIAAAVAGILVYVSLEAITRSFRGARESIEKIQFAKGATVKTAIGLEFGARLALRLGTIVGWLSYATFWFSVVLPYSILIARLGLNEAGPLMASVYLFDGLMLLALSIHLHIIFLRLFLLRPRVFGEQNAIALS